MRKKIMVGIVLIFMVQALLVSCKSNQEEDPIENSKGGTTDYSTECEKIVSTDIKSFSIEFIHSNIDDKENRYTRPAGRYLFSMEKENGHAICDCKYYERADSYEQVTNELRFETDLSYFDQLQTLIEEQDLESINGYHKTNSALGDYLDLEIVYESEEELKAFAEGGGVMLWVSVDFFILFFSDMAEEQGLVLIEKPEDEGH